MKRLLLLLCLLLAGVPQSLAQPGRVAVPELRSPVTDLTGTLTQEQAHALELKLIEFEKAKGAQIAVLMVSSTAPEAIEQYSIRVVEQWKLGRQRIDDGVLLLVAVADRRLRIEVAYGLEGALTDLVSKRIIDGIIVPKFKQGEFFQGVDAGVDAIIRVVSGEPLPAPAGASGPGSFQIEFLVAPVVILLCFANLIKPAMGSGAAALTVGAIGLIGGALFLPFIAALFLGFVVAVLSWAEFSGVSGSSRGGYYSSSRGSSSSYSGGGGSFGGGGASGSW